jgi:methylmalonyl-CoA mutase
MFYEHKKHDGSLPIVGVNTYLNPNGEDNAGEFSLALERSTDEEKQTQIQRLRAFHRRHESASELAIQRLKQAAINNDNVFEVLMDAVQSCSLGQITNAFFEVGGQYRRNM